MLAAGTVVGGYRVEHLLGEGGMGTVYAAVEPTIGKRVAIKVLRAALSADDLTRARFEREARAVNAVRHPAVVEVFAFGQLPDGSPYFVMSLLEGCSLREELDKKGRIEPKEVWRIMREVADALSTAHASNIVHRDLKPDNIFLETFSGKPPRPRVLDFGIAKVLDLGSLGDGLEDDEVPRPKLTSTGAPIGTPTYMAPEQWWNEPTTARTDQYAFGVMLFELLSGKPPFRSKQYAELLQMHINSPTPSLIEAGFAASRELLALVERLMQKSPADRFEDFAAVIEALDAAFANDVGASVGEIEVASTIAVTPSIEVSRLPAARSSDEGARPAESKTAHRNEKNDDVLGRRFLMTAIVIAGLGFAALYAVGYAGLDPRNVGIWIRNSGQAIVLVLAAFPVAFFFLIRAGKARRLDTSPSYGPFFVALAPIVPSVIATYTGWLQVMRVVHQSQTLPHGFAVLNEGMFEASTARFLGFALTAILLLVVSALFGETPPRPTATSISLEATERRWSLGAALLLAGGAAAFSVFGAPSAALVAGCGALAEIVAFARPTTHPDSAYRDARDRAIASAAAILLVVGVALARVEARESALWATAPTRAARVAEIIDAARERALTGYALALTAIVFVAVELIRERRLRGRARALPIPVSGWVLSAVLVGTGALDVTFHQVFFAERTRLVEALREQFALFAELDPPSSNAPVLHEPSSAPALQITSETIAINGKRIAKLAALDSPAGKSNVGHDLTNSLASEGGQTDLSLLIDRRVPWGRVTALLGLACEAGARHAEVLFTRGDAPRIPSDAPPEAGDLLPSDFGALTIAISETGLSAESDAAFADVSREMLEAASVKGLPLPLNLSCSRGGK